jgi:phosphoenolpyruvate synthase/pyruvate phosphate dikinase
MDIEWAKDGITNELFIVQARPETIHSQKKSNKVTEYNLKQKAITGYFLHRSQAVELYFPSYRTGLITR